MLAAMRGYLDLGDKRDPKDRVMCVASVVFKPTKYKQFVRLWNPILDRWGASAFHATDFYGGYREFKRDTSQRQKFFDEDSKRIPAIIGQHIQNVLMVSFRPAEFLEKAPQKWKEKFGTSVHSHAIQLCLIANGWWRWEKRRHDQFAYFMESGDEDSGDIINTVERMRHDTETKTGEIIGVSSFTTVDKGKAKGLEAADFVAWQWNKHYMDVMRPGAPHAARGPRKDFVAFVQSAGKKRVKTIDVYGEKLKYFFSLVPAGFLEGTDGTLKDI